MDIDGQHAGLDPYGVKADARAVIAEHSTPASATGCCSKCGRPTDSTGLCDAPEVLQAQQVLQEPRPSTRRPGANTRIVDYARK